MSLQLDQLCLHHGGSSTTKKESRQHQVEAPKPQDNSLSVVCGLESASTSSTATKDLKDVCEILLGFSSHQTNQSGKLDTSSKVPQMRNRRQVVQQGIGTSCDLVEATGDETQEQERASSFSGAACSVDNSEKLGLAKATSKMHCQHQGPVQTLKRKTINDAYNAPNTRLRAKKLKINIDDVVNKENDSSKAKKSDTKRGKQRTFGVRIENEATPLSEYEQLRLRNIARNEERLRQLGLSVDTKTCIEPSSSKQDRTKRLSVAKDEEKPLPSKPRKSKRPAPPRKSGRSVKLPSKYEIYAVPKLK